MMEVVPARQSPVTWAISRWLLWLLLAAHLWIAITGRGAESLSYPREPAALMIIFLVGMLANSWRTDHLGIKPALSVTVVGALAFVAAIVVGIAIV